MKEERRFRVDNQPYGKTSEVLDEMAFENFVNKHSVIGSMADLDTASLDDFTAFYKTYYAPNNAVLAISGDVDPRSRSTRSGNTSAAFPLARRRRRWTRRSRRRAPRSGRRLTIRWRGSCSSTPGITFPAA